MKIEESEDRERDEISISQISKISKKVARDCGQLYGGDQNIGKIQEDFE